MNLSAAVRQNNVERVKELLANETVNVNAADNHNFTALHHSVVVKNAEIIRLLLSHKKIDPTIKTFEGLTPLFLAIVWNCQIEIIKMLIKKNRLQVNVTNNEEVAPIHEAVKNRRLDVVQLLINSGANVNSYDLDLENCLHLAASNCDFDTIEYLLKETEVDTTARNRDEMNPLCLLLVRSRNEPASVVLSCFNLIFEHTYEKDRATGCYDVSDLFQPAFLATVYSHTEIAKLIIHNFYSVNNLKYEFVRRLCVACEPDEDEEFLYYLLVFLHDRVDRFDKFSFPRFSEINYFMCIRSVIYVLQKLLESTSEDTIEMAISLLNDLQSIGLRIRVREFEDQVGVMLFDRFTRTSLERDHIERVEKLLKYFFDNKYNINTTIKSVLHSIAVSKENRQRNYSTNCFESSTVILKILLPYSTNFFTDEDSWKQINEFKSLNHNIERVVQWLNENYGNYMTNLILDTKNIYTLKHLCRNVIREQLAELKKSLHIQDFLIKLNLPDIMANYLIFR